MNPVPLFFGYYEHGDIILNYYISMLWAWFYSKLYLHQYLPLFFVVMKINVNYQVVALFVLQDETTAAIIEALSVIKTWNPIWNPKWFVVDKCDKDIKWIGNIFLYTYMNCFNLFVLIKNLFIVQNTIHFWKCAKKYHEWFGFVSTKLRFSICNF